MKQKACTTSAQILCAGLNLYFVTLTWAAIANPIRLLISGVQQLIFRTQSRNIQRKPTLNTAKITQKNHQLLHTYIFTFTVQPLSGKFRKTEILSPNRQE